MKIRWITLIVLISLVIGAGCQSINLDANAPSNVTSNQVSTPDTASSQEVATPDRIDDIMTKSPEIIPPTDDIPPVTGEVPSEILDLITKDLIGKTGAAQTSMTIIRSQEVVWNDGSLGCPQPGVLYTQAPVNGYWVVLEVDGKAFDYRATDRGYFFLCEGGSPPGLPPATPSS